MAYQFTIDGVKMPLPDAKGGISETFEPRWASDYGTTANGSTVGTLLCTKTHLTVSYEGLRPEDCRRLLNAIVGKVWVEVSYYSMKSGGMRTLVGHFTAPKLNQRRVGRQVAAATQVSLEFEEK